MKTLEYATDADSPREREAAGAVPLVSPEMPRSEGIRDTLEAVVVAFILAFVFRAFVVEAFVIPTGSMAPGLSGKHGSHRCDCCQYPFDYGIRESVTLPGGRRQLGTLEADQGFKVRCPNCGWSDQRNLNTDAETRVVADSGDRILVLKWPYDVGGNLLGPKRWDVVVFKNPQDGETNFIKRLLGLPGEVLEIINGDVYAVPEGKVPADIREALSKPPATASMGRAASDRRLTREQRERLAGLLEIRRKTQIAQDSLWMIHYDHDYPPSRAPSVDYNPPRWVAEGTAGAASWDVSKPRVRFRPPDDEAHWLRLTGKPIGDTYGYNLVSRGSLEPRQVADVRLQFVLFPGGGDGRLILRLGKGPDQFFATIDAGGNVTLERAGKDGIRVALGSGRIDPLRADNPLTVSFENVDYRVALRIEDVEVVATDDDQYRPNILPYLLGEKRDGESNAAHIAIGAEGMPLEIRHLTVHRDVFYRSSDTALDNRSSTRGQENAYKGYPGWGTATNPILLRADPPDYFCCGDNSPQSKDSRLWWEVAPMLRDRQGDAAYQLGTVPGDQMIGRAFFVYWPGGLRFLRETPAVIPRMGRMRIIR